MINVIQRYTYQGNVWLIRVYYSDGTVCEYKHDDSGELESLASDMINTLPDSYRFYVTYCPYDDGDSCCYHYVTPSSAAFYGV